MNTLLEQLIDSASYGCTSKHHQSNISIKNSENEFIAEVILPGFSKQDISILADDKILEIDAQNDNRGKESFKIRLNGLVSTKDIHSKLENGILKLSLPKNSHKDRLSITVG
jgi:HSP20 family protein